MRYAIIVYRQNIPLGDTLESGDPFVPLQCRHPDFTPVSLTVDNPSSK